jgi:hypothetical protein
MKASTRPVHIRSITTISTPLPRWDTTLFRHMGTDSPMVDSRTLRLLYLLCTLTRSRLLSMSPHIGLDLRTRQLHDSPSGRLISLCSHSLPSVPPLVPQLGALVRYVVFIVDVVVGTTLLFSLTDRPFTPTGLTHSPSLRTLSRLPYPDLQYILVDFSFRMKPCAADPLCFYFPICRSDPLATIPSC